MNLFARDLPRTELVRLVAALSIPIDGAPPLLLWVECPDRAEVLRADGGATELDAEALVRRSTGGRLFGEAGELRWRTIGRASAADGASGAPLDRVVYLGPEVPAAVREALADRSVDIPGHKDGPKRRIVALWGRLERGSEAGGRLVWVERRIPRRFEYPWSGPGAPPDRLGIEQELWRAPDGRVSFVRFVSLCPAPAGEAQTEMEPAVVDEGPRLSEPSTSPA